MQIASILLVVLLFAESSFAFEWVQPKDKDAVIAQVMSLAQVQEFLSIYPHANFVRMGIPNDVMFSAESEKEVKETLYAWFSIGLYNRYVLQMAVPFKLAEDRIHLATVEPPVFGIQEAQSIMVTYFPDLPGGQAHIQFSTFSVRFGYEKFKALKEHGGDFDTIGIALRACR